MRGDKAIAIPGELYSAAEDGIVSSADGIWDYRLGKSQEEINEENDVAPMSDDDIDNICV